MSINVNNGYEQFYKGTEQLKNYGSNGKGKTKLVRYEFNTTDEKGNKIMDKMSREETLQAMKEISAQYGDDVLVQFSGDGMAKLIEDRKGYLDRPLSDEEAAAKAAKQAEFDGTVVQLENTHRMVIPNVQTNDRLYNSLAGTDEEVVKAANGIIKNYLLPANVSDMSEDERKAMIAFGMEEAKYLAENYLDQEHSGEFLSAMETIAKYGMNGTVSENGTVTYHIEKGLNSARAVSDMDILKEKAPDLYNEINELNQRIINHKPREKFGAKFLELHKRAEKVLEETKETAGTQKSTETTKSSSNEEYLNNLQKQVPYIKLQTGYGLNANNDGKVNVVDISPKLLEKMQNDPQAAKEYTQRLKDVEAATKWVDNFEKSMGYTAICRHGYVDENGNFSSFAVVVRKDELNEKLRKEAQEDAEERIEKSREKTYENAEQLAKKLEEKLEKTNADVSKTEKAGQLLADKIENAEDGKIVLDNDDMQTIIEVAKDEDTSKKATKGNMTVGANLDLMA